MNFLLTLKYENLLPTLHGLINSLENFKINKYDFYIINLINL